MKPGARKQALRAGFAALAARPAAPVDGAGESCSTRPCATLSSPSSGIVYYAMGGAPGRALRPQPSSSSPAIMFFVFVPRLSRHGSGKPAHDLPGPEITSRREVSDASRRFPKEGRGSMTQEPLPPAHPHPRPLSSGTERAGRPGARRRARTAVLLELPSTPPSPEESGASTVVDARPGRCAWNERVRMRRSRPQMAAAEALSEAPAAWRNRRAGPRRLDLLASCGVLGACLILVLARAGSYWADSVRCCRRSDGPPPNPAGPSGRRSPRAARLPTTRPPTAAMCNAMRMLAHHVLQRPECAPGPEVKGMALVPQGRRPPASVAAQPRTWSSWGIESGAVAVSRSPGQHLAGGRGPRTPWPPAPRAPPPHFRACHAAEGLEQLAGGRQGRSPGIRTSARSARCAWPAGCGGR